MPASVRKKASEKSERAKTTKVLSPVPLLHRILMWPAGRHVENEMCPHCGKKLETGDRVAVLDARVYQKGVSEGTINESTLYGHALCIQEAARGGRGWYPLTTLA